jgi:hypothetical protein
MIFYEKGKWNTTFQTMLLLFSGFNDRLWPRPFSKTMYALFLGPSENLTVTACEDNAAPFSKTMRALFFEAVSEFCGDGVEKRCGLFLKDNARN